MQILAPLCVCHYLWSSGKLVQHMSAQMAFIRERRMSASILYITPSVGGTIVSFGHVGTSWKTVTTFQLKPSARAGSVENWGMSWELSHLPDLQWASGGAIPFRSTLSSPSDHLSLNFHRTMTRHLKTGIHSEKCVIKTIQICKKHT